MKNWIFSNAKTLIAIILIISGILALIIWENWGREATLYEKVVVAAKDIQPGVKVTEELLIEKPFIKDTIIKGSVTKNEAKNILNKIAKQYIPENSQVVEKFFFEDNFHLKDNESIFKIPASWIASRSASIRRGDLIQILNGEESLGIFRVAFVKDAEEREIVSAENQQFAGVLERTDSSGIINNIEIITTLEKYNELSEIVNGNGTEAGKKFLIMQVEEEKNE